MIANPFIPQNLVGRCTELQQVSQILAADGDLLIAGVPGSGRRTLVDYAAEAVGARVIHIDCLRATDSQRFLTLLAEGLLSAFTASADLAFIHRWSTQQPIVLESSLSGRPRLVWHATGQEEEWQLFQALLALPQQMAEWLNCRVVIVFQDFPHIRSWDRSDRWQRYLSQEIQRQSRVSYALIAHTAEQWVDRSNLTVVSVGPLAWEDVESWVLMTLATLDLTFDSESQALDLFLDYVQGHLGDAIALIRRIWLDYQAQWCAVGLPPKAVIQAHHVHRSALALIEDMTSTFESLILLLPPSQVRLLESLALDPTDSPQSREYIQRHQLSRGGGLQGALASLEQKGLVYGPEYGYRITMPLLALWLKHRLL